MPKPVMTTRLLTKDSLNELLGFYKVNVKQKPPKPATCASDAERQKTV